MDNNEEGLKIEEELKSLRDRIAFLEDLLKDIFKIYAVIMCTQYSCAQGFELFESLIAKVQDYRFDLRDIVKESRELQKTFYEKFHGAETEMQNFKNLI